MLDTPFITQTAPQFTAVIHLTIPRDEIHEVMGPAIRELLAAVAEQGIALTGPWFTRHLRRPTETFDFECSVPVAAPITAVGRMKPSEWPAMKVARTTYHGPYEGLGDAWAEFLDWIAANGHSPGAELYECYLIGPESSDDPSKWRTELSKPLTT